MRCLLLALTITGAIGSPCLDTTGTTFPDPEDCGRFYMCHNGFVVGHMTCPDGLLWNSDLNHCDWPSNVDCRDKADRLADAVSVCEALGARLAEIGTEEESAAVVSLAVDAMTGNGDQLDYWLGAEEVAGEWRWLSGATMEFTNWWGGAPDGPGMGGLKGGCIQLLRRGNTEPRTLDSFYWARAATNAACTNKDGDNGVICEMEAISR